MIIASYFYCLLKSISTFRDYMSGNFAFWRKKLNDEKMNLLCLYFADAN